MLLIKFLQLKSKFGWSLSHLVAFLRWNLFSYKDLWPGSINPLKLFQWHRRRCRWNYLLKVYESIVNGIGNLVFEKQDI